MPRGPHGEGNRDRTKPPHSHHPGTKKSPHCCGDFCKGWDCSGDLSAAAELGLELLDATSGVDEALLTCKGGVRVGGDVADGDLVFDAVNGFSLRTTQGGTSQKFSAGRNVNEGNRLELWMDISFHSKNVSLLIWRLALTRFKARVRLADYVNTALTTNNLAVRVTVLERFE